MDEFLDIISRLLEKKISLINSEISYLGYGKKYGTIRFLFSFSGEEFYINLTCKSSSPNYGQTGLFNISTSILKSPLSIDPLLKLFYSIVRKIEDRLSDQNRAKIKEFFPKHNLFSSEKFGPVGDVIITGRCNVRCTYCKNNDEPGYNKTFSIDSLKSTIQSIRREYSDICFDGGEPTTHPDFIELVRYSKELGFNSISVITNGVRLSDPNFLHDIYKAGLSHINLSFSAHLPELSAKIYGRDISEMQLKALDNMGDLRTLFSITTQIIILKDSQDYLHDMIEHMLKINPDNLILINPFSIGEFTDHLPNIESIDIGRYLEQVSSNRDTTFKIRHFPLCKTPKEFWENMEESRYDEISFRKADVCKPCARMRECYFSSKAYLKTYPEQELVPFLEK